MTQLFKNLSIRVKIITIFALVISLACIFIVTYFPVMQKKQVAGALRNKAESTLNMLAAGVSFAFGETDYEVVNRFFSLAKNDSSIIYIVILDEAGNQQIAFNPQKIVIPVISSQIAHKTFEDKGMLHTYTSIDFEDEDYITLIMGFSLEDRDKQIAGIRWTGFAVSIAIFFVCFVLSIYLSKLITNPIQRVIKTINQIGRKGDYHQIIGTRSNDEVALIEAFTSMVANLEDAKKDLILTNQVLEKRAKDLEEEVQERRRAENEKEKLEAQLRQSQKMQAIGTLAGGVAHDFNNILWVILGNTEMGLRKTPKDSPVHSNLQEILTASNRAKNLVDQILAFSRQDEQERSAVQIHIIAKEAVKMLESTLPAIIEIRKNIDLSCGSVFADPTQIHQMILNLGTNAYHAMEDKNGILEISLNVFDVDSKASCPELHQGKYVELTVSDSGCGMDKETMERIFEPFFTTKEVGEGTGLGLATVHGIVKSMGGAIKVYSEIGEGTTFRIFLPQHGEENSGKIEKQQELPDLKGNERILIVDDEQQVVKMVQEMLEELSYTVTTVTDSKAALERFASNPDDFDLVITDQTMPEMTGVELAKQIIHIRPDIPILLTTGFSKTITEEKIKNSDIRKYLRKPIVFHDLEKVVRQVLDGKDEK